jgi:hypothetical protein
MREDDVRRGSDASLEATSAAAMDMPKAARGDTQRLGRLALYGPYGTGGPSANRGRSKEPLVVRRHDSSRDRDPATTSSTSIGSVPLRPVVAIHARGAKAPIQRYANVHRWPLRSRQYRSGLWPRLRQSFLPEDGGR